MSDALNAVIYHPSRFIRKAMEALSWSESDLVKFSGLNSRDVNRILLGKIAINNEHDAALSTAFRMQAGQWQALQGYYDLAWRLETEEYRCWKKIKTQAGAAGTRPPDQGG